MTNARLQLVFLGQLIDGESDANANGTRCELVGAPIATDHQEELVLWHDLDADEARRVASRARGLEGAADHATVDAAPAAAARSAATAKSAEWTPFPVLEDIADEPPPRQAPAQPARRAPRSSHGPTLTSHAASRGGSAALGRPGGGRPLPASAQPKRAAVSAHEVRCPNCNTRQTMRVLCRGCASFLEVALKAKAERDADARAKARPGLFAMLGL